MKGITGSFSSWRTDVSAPERLNRSTTSRPMPEVMQQIRNTLDEPVRDQGCRIQQVDTISTNKMEPQELMQRARGTTVYPETFSYDNGCHPSVAKQFAHPYTQYGRNPGGQYSIPHTTYTKEKTITASNLAMTNYLLKSIENEDSFDDAMFALRQNVAFGSSHFQRMVITKAKDHIQKAQDKLLAEEAKLFLARSKKDFHLEIATWAWMKQKSKLDLRILLLQRVIDNLLT